jgi:hypothetical protein
MHITQVLIADSLTEAKMINSLRFSNLGSYFDLP